MQTLKQKGFTLIELLVVIVIIGILATISVATFSGYFAKARDSERLANIRNAATIMKTARAVDTITTFALTEANVKGTMSSEGGFGLPDGAAPRLYYYIHEDTGNEFAFAVCGEETVGEVFADGTSALLAYVQAAAATMCVATPIPVTDAMLDTAGAALTPALPADDFTVIDMTSV